MSNIFENYKNVVANVEKIAKENNVLPEKITVLPVSKTFPVEDILELYNNGIRIFGESRLQELTLKNDLLPKDIKWHFIGTLQSNKIAKIVSIASIIHSVNSLKILNMIENCAEKQNKKIDFLLEINVANEDSKTGAKNDEAKELIAQAIKCKFANFTGFMTMIPENVTEQQAIKYFSLLKELREDTEKEFSRELPILSMGMSGDYPAAICASSSLIRIGGAIFGKR